MAAEHQFTVVPEAALDALVAWACVGRPLQSHDVARTLPALPDRQPAGPGLPATEQLCRFGEGRSLFGVLARADEDPARPVVVMFNSGSVHHVGSNRLYVTLARELAARGLACLRFDLESIGDSVLRAPGRENYPYPRSATRDALEALDYLEREHGYRRFVLMGLCAGAHTAFHAALAARQAGVAEAILANPVSFYWEEGMSLEIVSRFEDMHAYKRSMRDPARWLKLARGEVDWRRLLVVALDRLRTVARSGLYALREIAWPRAAPRLSHDLRRLFARGCRVTLMVSEGDPGRDVLMAGAPRTAARAVKSGDIRIEMIPGGDHTLSRLSPREDFLRRLVTHLETYLERRKPQEAASAGLQEERREAPASRAARTTMGSATFSGSR
jgi:alpha/beta superfamily hydrolase